MTQTTLDKWEIAIASQLQELAEEIQLPIAALPEEAGRFLAEQQELVDFLFSRSVAGQSRLGDTDLSHTLIFRVYMTRRYAKDNNERCAISWVRSRLIKLIDGLQMPGAANAIKFVESQITAPVNGSWYMELSFTFRSSMFVFTLTED